MVDELVAEVRRPDMLTDTLRYLNQTVREAHFSTDRKAAILYRSNFAELQLTANVATGFSWNVTNPATFQGMSGVQYPETFDSDGYAVWPAEVMPGRHLRGKDHYYYRVGDTFVFSGYNGIGSLINLGFHQFPPSLKYYAIADRPATYDVEDGWSYHASYNSTDELKETARGLVTNWLIHRWADVISEGLRAKIYKRISDTERARLCYSAYESLRQGLWTSESTWVYQG
jgi:predicted secreted protein